MPLRFPDPLRSGDLIGVTGPSSGVPADLWPRLEFAVEKVRDRGFEVRVGECMDGTSHVSASAELRAAELQEMLLDPKIRAIVPPWGGETGIDVLSHLDWPAISRAEPTWVVGYSDIATLIAPLTLRTGLASVHGNNLMDTPYPTPDGLVSWLDVVTHDQGEPLVQDASGLRVEGRDEWETDPRASSPRWKADRGWSRFDADDEPVEVSGRLIGGCIETLANLTGTRYLDVTGWAEREAPEGVIVYLEAAGDDAFAICRNLHGMRLAGLFERANAVLIGRTDAPDSPTMTQREAVLDALGGLGVPIVGDVECGHGGPYLPLVNGASADIEFGAGRARITQHLR